MSNGEGIYIAKQLVQSKTEGQNLILKKYGLKSDTSVKLKINAVESEDLNLLRKKTVSARYFSGASFRHGEEGVQSGVFAAEGFEEDCWRGRIHYVGL